MSERKTRKADSLFSTIGTKKKVTNKDVTPKPEVFCKDETPEFITCSEPGCRRAPLRSGSLLCVKHAKQSEKKMREARDRTKSRETRNVLTQLVADSPDLDWGDLVERSNAFRDAKSVASKARSEGKSEEEIQDVLKEWAKNSEFVSVDFSKLVGGAK